MKAKITKHQYTKRMNALLAKKAQAEKTVEDFISAHDGKWTIELGDQCNKLHDAVADIEQEIKDLDWEWNTRHFTGSDWNEYQLVSMNID